MIDPIVLIIRRIARELGITAITLKNIRKAIMQDTRIQNLNKRMDALEAELKSNKKEEV